MSICIGTGDAQANENDERKTHLLPCPGAMMREEDLTFLFPLLFHEPRLVPSQRPKYDTSVLTMRRNHAFVNLVSQGLYICNQNKTKYFPSHMAPACMLPSLFIRLMFRPPLYIFLLLSSSSTSPNLHQISPMPTAVRH